MQRRDFLKAGSGLVVSFSLSSAALAQAVSLVAAGKSMGGVPLRRAAASARQALLSAAAARLQVPVADRIVNDGLISNRQGDKKIRCASLIDGKPMNLKLYPKAPLKPPSEHKMVGQSVPRVDIPAKLAGQFPCLHDFKLPGMLHARMIRPPGLGATLVSLDETALKKSNGFVKAASAIKVQWSTPDSMPEQAKLDDFWRNLPVGKEEPVIKTSDAAVALAGAVKRIKTTCDFAPPTHRSMGPSCAVADFKDGQCKDSQCKVCSALQGTHALQSELASVLGVAKAQVRMIDLDGAGCDGRNGHEDCSADAALVPDPAFSGRAASAHQPHQPARHAGLGRR